MGAPALQALRNQVLSGPVLLTGVSGFVGGALARRLVREAVDVHAIVRPDSEHARTRDLDGRCTLHVHHGSTEELIEILEVTRPEVVFHLASLFVAEHRPADVGPLIASNLLFSTQLVEAMARTAVSRLINTGTSWQHYHVSQYRPVNLYAATKEAFEKILTYYNDAHGVSCLTLKLFDTYGPSDPRKKLLNTLISAANAGTALDLSPGDQVVDLTYIDDVVSAFLCAAEMTRKEGDSPAFANYLVTGERYTLKELVTLVSRTLARPIDARFGKRPYRAREVMRPCHEELEKLPGWNPEIGLEEGLLRMAGM